MKLCQVGVFHVSYDSEESRSLMTIMTTNVTYYVTSVIKSKVVTHVFLRLVTGDNKQRKKPKKRADINTIQEKKRK